MLKHFLPVWKTAYDRHNYKYYNANIGACRVLYERVPRPGFQSVNFESGNEDSRVGKIIGCVCCSAAFSGFLNGNIRVSCARVLWWNQEKRMEGAHLARQLGVRFFFNVNQATVVASLFVASFSGQNGSPDSTTSIEQFP